MHMNIWGYIHVCTVFQFNYIFLYCFYDLCSFVLKERKYQTLFAPTHITGGWAEHTILSELVTCVQLLKAQNAFS